MLVYNIYIPKGLRNHNKPKCKAETSILGQRTTSSWEFIFIKNPRVKSFSFIEESKMELNNSGYTHCKVSNIKLTNAIVSI